MGLEAVTNRFGRVAALEAEPGKLDEEVLEAVGDWLGRSRVAALLVKEWLSLMGDHKVEDCFVAALLYNLPACLFMMQRNQLPYRPLLQEVSDTFQCDYAQVLEQFIKLMPLPVGLNALLGPGGRPSAASCCAWRWPPPTPWSRAAGAVLGRWAWTPRPS